MYPPSTHSPAAWGPVSVRVFPPFFLPRGRAKGGGVSESLPGGRRAHAAGGGMYIAALPDTVQPQTARAPAASDAQPGSFQDCFLLTEIK